MTELADQAPWVPEHAPDLSGPVGKAWRWEPDLEGRPQEQTGLGAWVLWAPQAHPAWDWHIMQAMSLAPVEGLAPAKLLYPQAEYELLVLALDPDKLVPDPRDPDPDAQPVHYLTPPDVVVQFHGVPGGPSTVPRLLELCALAVVDGHLIPDSDHQGSWTRSISTTLQHVREGRHDL